MTDIDHIAQTLRVDVGEVTLHCRVAGEGPLVLLLHGFPQTSDCWRHVIPRLVAGGYRVVAPDLRGHGASDKPRWVHAYRAKRLVGDVVGLADAFGAERVHLVGHDWGGLVAWYAAMHAPERLATLSILDVPHPLAWLGSLRTASQRRKSWYVFFFQLPLLPERMLRRDDSGYVRRMLAKDLRDADVPLTRADIDRAVAAIQRPGHARGTVNYYRAALRYDLLAAPWLLRHIDTPTLVLWGERDRFLEPHLAEPPPGWVSEVRMIRFPRGSHWLPEHLPDPVSEALLAHFSR